MVKLANDKIDLRVLAEQVEAAKVINAAGKPSFEAFALQDMEAVLQTSLDFDPGVPQHERHEMIHDGIFAAGAKGVITKESLLVAIGRLERAYLKVNNRQFHVLASLSLKHGKHLASLDVGGVRLSFHSGIPRRYEIPVAGGVMNWPQELVPAEYAVVVAKATARTPYEAFEVGSTALEQLRAHWNFALNRAVARRFFSPGDRPVNSILPGPYYTVHASDGSLALQTYWHNRQYRRFPTIDLANGWPALTKNGKMIRHMLRAHPYAGELGSAFLRYVRALDGTDFTAAFLELWGVLELLTETVGGRYDQTIKRTLFVFGETAVNRLILEHLRYYRNQLVHHGASQSESETYTLQLKKFVEALMYYHLVWRGRFDTLARAGEYLELPGDPMELKRRLKLLRAAVKFRGA
jgi:hypothetical protein